MPRTPLGIALLALAACGDAPSGGAGAGAPSVVLGTEEVEVVVRDWLEEEPAWEVRRAHPAAPPELVELCPARGPIPDGVERLALSLAPPAEVALTVDFGADRERGWPCRLEALVGIGHAPWGEERGPAPPALSVSQTMTARVALGPAHSARIGASGRGRAARAPSCWSTATAWPIGPSSRCPRPSRRRRAFRPTPSTASRR